MSVDNFLIAGIEDANKLSNAYLSPALKGFIYGMNSGWYHTAKVHKVLGVDVTIGVSAAFVPSEDEAFTFSSLGLSNLSANSASSPTLAGTSVPSSDLVTVTIPANTFSDLNGGIHPELTSTFKMPDGFKDDLPISAVPAPQIQVGIGLPYESEVIIRLFPKTDTGDLQASMFGIGLKKEITSWFGPLDKLPLHVSLLGTYSNMALNYDIESNNTASGQRAEFKLNTYGFDVIASLNFPIINIFGGVGFGSGSINTNLLGTYVLDYNTNLAAPNDIVSRTLTDPLSLSSNVSGVRANAGLRLSLGFFKLFGSYTLQEYNTLNVGIAFSFR